MVTSGQAQNDSTVFPVSHLREISELTKGAFLNSLGPYEEDMCLWENLRIISG